jgi:ABC-2 type transport system ATP-binding protein
LEGNGVFRLIEVSHITKCYGEKRALDDLSFAIGAGQVVGLLGLNGAGKSTTMNILTGYISATSGSVKIGGHDIASGGKARRITGYLPEQPAFYPEMRVDEHLDFICRLKGFGKTKRERRGHVLEICRRVGLAEVQTRMVRNLSKGYRQRVGFAQALAGEPKVIILDEPTAGLDPSQIIEMRKLIADCGQNSTVIVSSHILSEIQAVCGRVIVIDEGRLIADDTPERLTSGESRLVKLRVKGEPERISATLKAIKNVKTVKRLKAMEPGACDFAVTGHNGLDIREELFRALAAADLPMLSARAEITSLEDVFLRLIGGGEPASENNSGEATP